MARNRDDFSKSTIDILAKRVGFICSNPNCEQLTIGANEVDDKSTSIGIAAHISAASPGGPRYDSALTPMQRSHINNGIWLCSNCAKLIDTDTLKYTTEILVKWKKDAEEATQLKLNGEYKTQTNGVPYLEADLIWNFGGRKNIGYSNKNPIEERDGKAITVIYGKPIIHWELDWDFNFVIHNNSNFPAYNIQIESVGSKHFSHIDTLNKVNNLPPLQNIELSAKYIDYIEGVSIEADEIILQKIPSVFNELLKFRI